MKRIYFAGNPGEDEKILLRDQLDFFGAVFPILSEYRIHKLTDTLPELEKAIILGKLVERGYTPEPQDLIGSVYILGPEDQSNCKIPKPVREMSKRTRVSLIESILEVNSCTVYPGRKNE